MKYVMKQKVFSLSGAFTIKDENEQDHYLIEAKLLSFAKHFDVRDMDKNLLATITRKIWALKPTFIIKRNDEVAAVVSKNLFSFFGTRFAVNIPGPNDLEVQGNFIGKEYKFTRQGETVANVSKAMFSWSDTYGIDINEGEDDLLVLCCAVVVDTVCHE